MPHRRWIDQGLVTTCAFACAAYLARFEPAAWTLGLPLARFAAETWACALGASLRLVLGRERNRSHRAAAVIGLALDAVIALGCIVAAGPPPSRRRAVAMALGAALAVRLAAHPRLARWRAWFAAAAGIALLLMLRGDAAPFRTALPELRGGPELHGGWAPAGRRNVLLVTLDTTRARDLGPYGSDEDTSPHLDAFAKTAVVFENATAEAPHTHPSIATILTGTPPRVHGSISGAAHVAPGVASLAEHARADGYRTAGFLDNPWLGPAFGIARGYEHLDRRTDLRRIGRWLDGGDPRQPFLLHVHYFHPHGPYEPREAGREYVSAGVIQRGEVPGRNGFDAQAIAAAHATYLGEIRAMDADFCELLAAVEQRTHAEKLVVVVAADHGEEFGERGGMHHSHTLFEELLHVPLIFRAPTLAPERRADTVGLVDVAPTIAQLAGMPPLATTSSRSLFLSDATQDRVVFSERRHHVGHDFAAVRRGPWKLHVRTTLDGSWPRERALFRLDRDPLERNDLNETHADIADQLEQLLYDWRAACEAHVQRHGIDPRAPTIEVPVETTAQLRALGYR